MATTTRTVTIKSLTCGVCDIVFGLSSDFMAARQEDGQSFYCPNGHFVGWAESNKAAAEKKRRDEELAAARSLARREAQRRERAEAAARTSDYKARAARGQLTKAKKRAAAGVCPCCNRTFQNVARHMVGQHPDYPAGGDA